MAIYHLSTQPISRSQGRSIVACAAYRAAEKLEDQRYEKTHDYRRKQGVVHTEILLPQGAPDWMHDRETLWNHVEAIEKRKDARLAREIQFSLPRELSIKQNKALARDFVHHTFVKQGMVADVCLHMDQGKDGQEQPHCHVLLTTRLVNETGFGLKNPQWNKKEHLLEWREAWANSANQHLALHAHDIKIDHRSYVDQKIDLEPQYKIGTAKLRQQQERLADHQRIARENGERIYTHPEIALNALTKQQSTFTLHDLARFIHRHSDSVEQFHKVYERVQVADELIKLGKDTQGRERFTTKEMLALETRMLNHARALSEQNQGHIGEQTLARTLDKRSLSDEQKRALRSMTEPGNLKCVLGYAGTGKSYLLQAAREAWKASGYRVKGVALSGVATQNLQQSSGIESRTVASLLYSWDQGKNQLKAQDILVIDEAGMLGSRQMERILNEAQNKSAKVIILGDWQQLQAIDAGAAFRAIAEEYPYIELQEVRRQTSSWQKEATVLLAKGQVKEAFEKYQHHDQCHTFDTQEEAKKCLVEQWHDVCHTHPQESQLMMAYTRKDVKDLNKLARELKQQNAELGESYNFKTSGGAREFATGDRVYFLKRDDALGVINGTLGTITAIERQSGQIDVQLDHPALNSTSKQITVDMKQYDHLDHGYAATVYKAQGVTVDRSYLLTSKYDDAHSTYVAMSRHCHSCQVFSSREQFQNEKELLHTLSRHRAKDTTLDYTQPWRNYTRQREIQPDVYFNGLMKLDQRLKEREGFYETQSKLLVQAKETEERKQFWEKADVFLTKFEQTHPEIAKKICERFIPEHEQQALDYIKQFKAYCQLKPHLKEQQEFAKLTQDMMHSPLIMNSIRNHDQKIAEQMKETFKQHHELKHSKNYERSLGFGGRF